jgi:hypothetical protein
VACTLLSTQSQAIAPIGTASTFPLQPSHFNLPTSICPLQSSHFNLPTSITILSLPSSQRTVPRKRARHAIPVQRPQRCGDTSPILAAGPDPMHSTTALKSLCRVLSLHEVLYDRYHRNSVEQITTNQRESTRAGTMSCISARGQDPTNSTTALQSLCRVLLLHKVLDDRHHRNSFKMVDYNDQVSFFVLQQTTPLGQVKRVKCSAALSRNNQNRSLLHTQPSAFTYRRIFTGRRMGYVESLYILRLRLLATDIAHKIYI